MTIAIPQHSQQPIQHSVGGVGELLPPPRVVCIEEAVVSPIQAWHAKRLSVQAPSRNSVFRLRCLRMDFSLTHLTGGVK